MKNRAKCKLCGDVIESLHSQDYQLCKCGEIFVDGASEMYCGAKHWENFLRIDDDGNEVIPKIVDFPIEESITTKQQRIELLHEMIQAYKNLPQQAQIMPPTNYDLYAALSLLYEIIIDE